MTPDCEKCRQRAHWYRELRYTLRVSRQQSWVEGAQFGVLAMYTIWLSDKLYRSYSNGTLAMVVCLSVLLAALAWKEYDTRKRERPFSDREHKHDQEGVT